jgi:uncharacterized protein YbjT (DUF2867 family)
MPPLTAVVLGASGLIGEQVVQQLLQDNTFTTVRILVRKPLALSHQKLEQQVTDFNNHDDYKNKLGTGDCIFVCIGTTQAKVGGDKLAYRKVDFDIPVNAAKYANDAGFATYLLVSAIGANEDASNFYLKLKGEVERAVEAVGLQTVHIFRPSMLLGNRKEFRLGEKIAKAFMQLFSFAFVGAAKKYKGIEAITVAKAMVAAAKQNNTGVYIHDYTSMIALATK